MKNRIDSPANKKAKAAVGHIRHGGFGVTKKSVSKNVSMTPDRFERSQNKAKKITAKQRRSLFNADETQVYGSLADISQGQY